MRFKDFVVAKIVTFLIVLTASNFAWANGVDNEISKALYPTSIEDQVFIAKFFEIVKLHKNNDPLLEGPGPFINEFSLDKIPFALMTDDTNAEVNLVFFNWNLKTFSGLVLEENLTKIYGSPVYILRNVNKLSIASQGEKGDELANFSYILGSSLDFAPHSNYLSSSHPLRKALGKLSLPILSPSKQYIIVGLADGSGTSQEIEAELSARGGYINIMLGMMVHEIYHVQEGNHSNEHGFNDLLTSENRKVLIQQLKKDVHLKNLLLTYIKIIFSIGDALKNSSIGPGEAQFLAHLKTIIMEIKKLYPSAWSFVRSIEYSEGFAEYASAYSLIEGQVVTLLDKINLEKSDPYNHFNYRTGTIGGIYLWKRLNEMPFKKNEARTFSLWEIILTRAGISQNNQTTKEIISKYKPYPLNADHEFEIAIDYLQSSFLD